MKMDLVSHGSPTPGSDYVADLLNSSFKKSLGIVSECLFVSLREVP